ncbi:GTP-binding protein [Pendulispora rubella]|uniref:GTP-binding protein n=1 Tax=Pendulispora rubella TaxID=2741070 RepID=A0ABZ2KVU5_9BACT
MATKKKKICMLGATGVGKTSLVARFVHSIFSDAYRTTVGVTIDKAHVRVDDHEVDLVMWDLSGEDEFQSVQLAYLRGAAGYLLVADGTRRETVTTALSLQEAAVRVVGNIPLVLVLNKADVTATWDIDEDMEKQLQEKKWTLVKTSAKTGDGVESAFSSLTRAMLAADGLVQDSEGRR